jgi:hypothetical protein
VLSSRETFFCGFGKGISSKLKPGPTDGLEVKIRDVFVVHKEPVNLQNRADVSGDEVEISFVTEVSDLISFCSEANGNKQTLFCASVCFVSLFV